MYKYIIIVISLIGCRTIEEKNELTFDHNAAISQTIRVLFDSLAEASNLKGNVIYIRDVKDTVLIYHSKMKALSILKDDEKLVLEQIQYRNNQLISLDSITLNEVTIFFKESSIEKLRKENNRNGIFNISNVYYSSVKNLGCYYFDFQCGKTCGYGYFVFFEIKDGKYFPTRFFQCWT